MRLMRRFEKVRKDDLRTRAVGMKVESTGKN